jgi:hypothetical protein
VLVAQRLDKIISSLSAGKNNLVISTNNASNKWHGGNLKPSIKVWVALSTHLPSDQQWIEQSG